MKERQYFVALDDYEHGVVIRSLNDKKTELRSEGKSTDAVDDRQRPLQEVQSDRERQAKP